MGRIINKIRPKAGLAAIAANAMIFFCTPEHNSALNRWKDPVEIVEPVKAAGNNESESEALTYFKQFPEYLLGAGEINKFRYIGGSDGEEPKHVLVHIKQSHWVEGLDKELGELVKKSQADVLKIVSSLMDSYSLDTVYWEGVDKDSYKLVCQILERNYNIGEKIYNNLFDEITDLEDELKYCESTSLNPDDCSELRYNYENAEKIYGERLSIAALDYISYKTHSIAYLHCEKGLKIKPAESREISDLIDTMEKSNLPVPSFLYYRLVFEDREDFLLKTIVENGDKIAVTVYGADHSWYNNIQKWNREHPDQKFALIEVIPQSHLK